MEDTGTILAPKPRLGISQVAAKVAPSYPYTLFGMLVASAFSCLSGCSKNTVTEGSLPDLFSYRADSLNELRDNFKSPPHKAGPWVYWFWFDNVLNKENITRELEEIASAGIAGVELRSVSMHGFTGTPGPMYNPDGWAELNHTRYDYFSPEWVDILEHTLTEAKRLNLYFALNLGMGWPPGGKWISEEHRSRHFISTSHEVSGPMERSRDQAIPVPPEGARVSAWRLAQDKSVDPESYLDLTGLVDADGYLSWDIPEGQWLVGIFQTVPGHWVDKGEGPELDPANQEGVLFHLNYMFDRLSPQLDAFFGTTLVSMATDSWEYGRSRTGRYWSPVLLRESENVLGYDFTKHMYSLLEYGPNQAQLLSDLAHLEKTIVNENYFKTVGNFLHERGIRHRPQVYGRGLARDLFDTNAIVDIPELEEGVYAPEAVWVTRLLNKPIVSEEAFTHLSIRDRNLRINGLRGPFTAVTNPDDMWKTTPERLKHFSNAHYARGIQRIHYHSFSYSPPGIPDPGWRMYAEIFLNRNVPWWNEWKPLNTWMSRNQYVLQSGTPITESLVFPQEPNPIDGPWNVPDDQPWTAMNSIDAANANILSLMIQQGDDWAGRIMQVILRKNPLSLEVAKDLLALVDLGIPVWCLEGMPASWEVLQEENDSSLANRFQSAVDQGLVKDARGRSWESVAQSNRSVRWEPAGAKLSYQRRKLDGGELFLISSWEEPIEGEVLFSGVNGSPEIWDAESGEVRILEDTQLVNGSVVIPLQLDRNDSLFVVFSQ